MGSTHRSVLRSNGSPVFIGLNRGCSLCATLRKKAKQRKGMKQIAASVIWPEPSPSCWVSLCVSLWVGLSPPCVFGFICSEGLDFKAAGAVCLLLLTYTS